MSDFLKNKPVLDLIFDKTSELSKHHANEAIELIGADMDARFDTVSTNLNTVTDLISEVSESQVGDVAQLDALSLKVIKVGNDLKQFDHDITDKNKEALDLAITSVKSDIDNIKGAVVELAETVDDSKVTDELSASITTLSELVDTIGNVVLCELKESIDKLTVDVGTIGSDRTDDVSKLDERIVGNTADIETLSETVDVKLSAVTQDMSAIDKQVDSIDQYVAQAKDELSEKIKDIRTQIADNANDAKSDVADVDAKVEAGELAYGTILADIKNDIMEFDNRVGNIKANLVGYGEDLATLSDSLHKDVERLSDGATNFNDELVNVRAAIVGTETVISEAVTGFDDLATSLSEQFSELKNESFLTSDKIDLKFSEMQLTAVESDIKRTEIIKGTIQKHVDVVKVELDDCFAQYAKDLSQDVQDKAEQTVSDVKTVLNNDKKLLSRAKQWVPGTEYGEGIITRNLNGLWQCTSPTTSEPVAGAKGWVCLTSSFHNAKPIDTHKNGASMTVGFEDSLGNVSPVDLPIPQIDYQKGPHVPGKKYLKLDSIMKDGCRWVANKDAPEGVPGEDSDDWRVLTMRPPRGIKGATGPRGANGPQGETGALGLPGKKGNTGKQGASSKAEYLYTKTMLSPMITRVEIDDLVKSPVDGQLNIIHSDIGIERYFRCEYIGAIDKWAVDLIQAV